MHTTISGNSIVEKMSINLSTSINGHVPRMTKRRMSRRRHVGATRTQGRSASVGEGLLSETIEDGLQCTCRHTITPSQLQARAQKEMEDKQRYADIILNFFENSTFHGVYEIYFAGNPWLRNFWICAFIGGLGASIYGIVAIVLSYSFSPVAVSYVVREYENARLPDVVVCPFNRFNNSFLAQHNVHTNLTEYIGMAFGFSGKIYRFQQDINLYFDSNNSQQVALEAEMENLLERTNMTFTEFVYKASITCNSIVPYCVESSGPVDCCRNAVPVMTSVGKCYRFMGIHQSAAGYGFGLTIYVTLPVKYYTPAVSNLHNDGVAVKLVEHGHGLDYDIAFVPSGVHALMPVRATKFEFINDPPRYECLPPVERYSRIQCFASCIFGAGHKACNCSHIASKSRDLEGCTTKQFYKCLIPETDKEFRREKNKMQKCQQRCKPLCSYWQYSSAISYAKIPSATIRKFLDNNWEYEKMKDTIILDVFFERLEYHMIQHFPTKTPDTFIANIGGQLGLWVGGSVLTLLQVVVCSCQLLCQSLKPISRRGNKSIRRIKSRRNLLHPPPPPPPIANCENLGSPPPYSDRNTEWTPHEGLLRAL